MCMHWTRRCNGARILRRCDFASTISKRNRITVEVTHSLLKFSSINKTCLYISILYSSLQHDLLGRVILNAHENLVAIWMVHGCSKSSQTSTHALKRVNSKGQIGKVGFICLGKGLVAGGFAAGAHSDLCGGFFFN